MAAILADKSEEIEKLIAKYPSRQSALLPVLWMVQNREGWVSQEAMKEVADIIGCTAAQVYEVVSFYTMFQQKPTGRHHLAICKTLSCAITGAFEIEQYIRSNYGFHAHDSISEDGRFSIELVECIGACSMAPAILVGEKLYGNLTPERLDEILGGYA